ncbi:MAG: hypothetical protein AAFY71_16045 [Bacteroidota bacterium]
MKYYCILALACLFFSCELESIDLKEEVSLPSPEPRVITIEHFFMDESEITSSEWKDFYYEFVENDSLTRNLEEIESNFE